MAKDTEKLIRQLSLISFLMAERRPVSALEIRQDVEGYAQMSSDEAFNRRFYADRAELSSLGIDLKVERSSEGSFEAETYTLPPENFYLPAIEFSDQELGALRTALALLDGEFAYAEPLRLALQQLSWGKPSPLSAPEHQSVRLAMTASGGGRDLSQRLSKIETAIFRRKTILFEYYTMGRDAEEKRKVDPYHLLFQGGQFYLVGYAHERDAVRVFRLSRIRGKVGLLLEGRARLPASGGLRSQGVRQPRGLAARRDAGHRADLAVRPDRVARHAPPGRGRGHGRAGGRRCDLRNGLRRLACRWCPGCWGSGRARASWSRRSWWRRRRSESA